MPSLLWLISAFLIGVLIEWALEIFFFRRGIMQQVETARATSAEWSAKYQQQQVALQTRETELHDAHTASNQLAAKLEACTNARAELEQANQSLAARLNQTEAQLTTAAKRSATLEADLNARRTELTQVRLELDNCLVEKTNLDANVATTAATTRAFADDKSRLEKQIAELNAQLAQARAEVSASAYGRTQLEQRLQARDTEITTLRADLDGRTAQTQNLTADLAKFTAGASTATKTIHALEADQARLEKQSAELQAQLAQANAELSASTNARVQSDLGLAARDAEIAQLRAGLDAHAALNKNFTTNAATTSATIKTLEGDKAGLAVQVEQLKNDLRACADARAALAADLFARNAEIENLHAQITSLAMPPTRAPATDTAFANLRNRHEDDETPFEAACPQHLSDIKGIGSVYEQRLYAAGIGSYWELAHLSDDDFKRILEFTPLQLERINLNDIRADALRLAKATKSQGRRWTRQAPDDFEPLEGIGHTYEKRLYDAGICTFEALANASVELLEEICHAPAQFRPDYALWIKQAQEIVTQRAH